MKFNPFSQLTAVSALLFAASMAVQAHSPFIAPQAYTIDGDGTAVIGGFAEAPFASEFALSGFAVAVNDPNGQVQQLELKGTKFLTAADAETKAEGTYKITATRENKLEFANVNGKWLRVMESHNEQLPPLAERNFITPAEVTAKIKKVSSTRYEQLIGYFSKAKLTDTVLQANQKGLDVQFSQHPNSLTTAQPLTLTFTVDGKVHKGLDIVAIKQWASVDEKEIEIKQTSNEKGQVQLAFPQAGQYIIEVNSPATAEKAQPAAQTYRLNIALQVN
ncbi:MAG: DUF4198 domain-containing protein [Acinetobacter populi]|jgi:hypothetical protein|uniref:DUF4198 domain-containing protein n=1 Tax=Acinetobacter populi TaxID=1582270 RepID=UPI0023525361|nr:DUF4198 domain-containing protein [Acinetobacter populi]MCH4247673.1 DUF4198 domain-containing protein [Acinetobacter populi]